MRTAAVIVLGEMAELQAKLDQLFEEAKRWCVVWGLSRLMRDVTVDFSNDLGSKLGVCDLGTMTVTLNGTLLQDGKEGLLHETLCHELAHIVASLRYTCAMEEHGPEWADYMRKAGFEPRACIPQAQVLNRPISSRRGTVDTTKRRLKAGSEAKRIGPL